MKPTRVSKREARKAYNNGEDVWLTTSNFPFDHNADRININDYDEEGRDFDEIVEDYKFHNCDRIRGGHAHYYLK